MHCGGSRFLGVIFFGMPDLRPSVNKEFGVLAMNKWIYCCLILIAVLSADFVPQASAQDTARRHRLAYSTMAPGRIAHQFLMGDPSLAAHVQPVKFVVPEDCLLSIWDQGAYTTEQAKELMVGLGYGPVYRFKVSNVRGYPGVDVYPSIEMLGRLHPPTGLETQHPVNIVLDRSDLVHAIEGRMITRVIYLEDPTTALPFRRKSDEQPYFDCSFREDPLHVAERLGRVMAIVRIGSRTPIPTDGSDAFEFQGAPVQQYGPQIMQPPAAIEPMETTQVRPGNVIHAGFSQATATQNGELAFPAESAPIYCPPITTDCPPVEHCPPIVCPPVVCPPLAQPACQPGECCEADIPEAFRDEWVCDGNDRKERVRVDQDFNVSGLDIEDTVGHFDTPDGRTLVAPSNRVCVYSPRFAAVRKVHQFGNSVITTRLKTSKDKTQLSVARGEATDAMAFQNVRLQSSKLLRHPSLIKDRTRGVVADNTIQLVGTRANFKTYEDLQLMRWGKHRRSENTRLELGMQSAKAWNDNLEPLIALKNAQPIIVNDSAQLGEMVAIESKLHPTLRICKIASRMSAKPGDTVDFTIRFDNLGNQRIGNVTLMDSLSPRLEFVEGSAECTLDANFIKLPNDAGSFTLRWEITDPIEVGKGGVVRFQCRVR